MLKKRLDLQRFDQPAPYRELDPLPDRVTIRHRQHAGLKGQPLLRAGQRVTAGEVVGQVDPKHLGVPVHAPFAGVVRDVNADATVIEREP